MTGAATHPDLAGKSVFVTGGASGIGLALVKGFVAQGARVAFADLADPAEEVAALAIRADVTDTAALRAAMDAAAEAHGPIDVLVNNVASDRRFDSLAVTEAEWDAQAAVNLRHVFFASQHAARSMAERGAGGAIVSLSSIVHLMPAGGMTPYAAAKAAIAGMTRTLAQDWGGHGIRVNALAPGMVLTDRQLRDWITPEVKAAVIDRQALKRELYPADMVGPALFLASEAAAAITGQCLIVDAGVVGTG